MISKDYVLTIKIPIDAKDDIEARNGAQKELQKYSLQDDVETKLQRIFNNKAPRKVEID